MYDRKFVLRARAHVAKAVQQKIKELGWTLLPHPPYSPDMAPSDYCLLRSMQHALAENKFENSNQVKIWVQNYFDTQPAEFFKDGIRSLRDKWRMVIDNNGEYIV